MKRLHEEISYLKERINKLDSLITSTKYEITHKLNEQSVVGQSVLRVVNSGD
jgi:prefoldin subunit 5